MYFDRYGLVVDVRLDWSFDSNGAKLKYCLASIPIKLSTKEGVRLPGGVIENGRTCSLLTLWTVYLYLYYRCRCTYWVTLRLESECSAEKRYNNNNNNSNQIIVHDFEWMNVWCAGANDPWHQSSQRGSVPWMVRDQQPPVAGGGAVYWRQSCGHSCPGPPSAGKLHPKLWRRPGERLALHPFPGHPLPWSATLKGDKGKAEVYLLCVSHNSLRIQLTAVCARVLEKKTVGWLSKSFGIRCKFSLSTAVDFEVVIVQDLFVCYAIRSRCFSHALECGALAAMVKKVAASTSGWWGGSIGRASDSDPKDEGLNPVRSTKQICEFFRVKNVVLTRCRCAHPSCVHARTIMITYRR